MLVRSMILLAGSQPPPTLQGVTFGVGIYICDAGDYFRVEWAINNARGGEYVTIEWNISAGTCASIGPGGPDGPFTTSPTDIVVGGTGLGSGAAASATVRLYSAGAVLLDTVVLPDQPLPT